MKNCLKSLSVFSLKLIFGLCVSVSSFAMGEVELLPEHAYLMEMEEIIVQGQVPEWRKEEMDKELWNRFRFRISKETTRPRIEWFPLYTKDERDNYDGPRDRKEEKPEFKLFEWIF